MGIVKTQHDLRLESKSLKSVVQEQNEIITKRESDLKVVFDEYSRVTQELSQYKNHAFRRHQVDQAIGYALRTLPFWKRSKRNIMRLAGEYFNEVEELTNLMITKGIAPESENGETKD